MAMSEGRPWKDPISSTGIYDVYEDGFPVNEGHLLYVPRVDTRKDVVRCMEAAYQHGMNKVKSGEWDAFNVGINIGEAAGQTCSFSHVHLIPRMKGDMEDPTGGVRYCIPSKGNYKTSPLYEEHRKKIYGK